MSAFTPNSTPVEPSSRYESALSTDTLACPSLVEADVAPDKPVATTPALTVDVAVIRVNRPDRKGTMLASSARPATLHHDPSTLRQDDHLSADLDALLSLHLFGDLPYTSAIAAGPS